MDDLERTKSLVPPEPDLELEVLDDEMDEESWPGNPVLGAEELLRFSRIRHLLCRRPILFDNAHPEYFLAWGRAASKQHERPDNIGEEQQRTER